MTDITKITKQDFERVTNMYPPNWITRQAYGFLHIRTVRTILIGSLIAAFVFMVIRTVFEMKEAPTMIALAVYGGMLFITDGISLVGKWMNDARLRKIMRRLDVTPEQYDSLVNKFYS